MLAYSKISHEVDAPLEREQGEREHVGDEPGAAPVANTDVPPRAHASAIRARSSSSRLRPSSKNSTQVVTTSVPASGSAHEVVDVDDPGHVEDAVGVEREDRLADRWWRATPVGASPHSVAGVDAGLGRVVHEDADELEAGVADHLAQRAGADVAGGPLDDPNTSFHAASPSCADSRCVSSP